MDWQSVVKTVAPVLGAALGGPLAGAATKVIAGAVLGNPDAPSDSIGEALITGLNPEALVALRKADSDFKLRMRELEIDVLKLNAESEKAYLSDVQNARQSNAQNHGVFLLGIAILLIFAIMMICVLWGSYQLLVGGIVVEDVAVVGTVAGIIGTVLGYVGANAQQVVNYNFGSSKGSADKTDVMANAIKDLAPPKSVSNS